MRGAPERQMAMLTTLSPEDLIPAEHPIRRIRTVVDEVLASLDGEFEGHILGDSRRHLRWRTRQPA